MPNSKCSFFKSTIFILIFSLKASSMNALTFDGSGHYSLRGESRTNPGMSGSRGLPQMIEQSYRLLGEARLNDRGSSYLEFRIFEDPENAYLGDQALLAKGCVDGSEEGCDGEHQSILAPKYVLTSPKITKFFTRYAFDSFIIEAGRRGRSWGKGLLLDAGEKPFSKDASVYDGVSFELNIQKPQTLGLVFGYDKISETGTYIRRSLQSEKNFGFGPGNKFDDIDQLFVALHYMNPGKAGQNSSKNISIYGARITSADTDKGGTSTELTLLDLFTDFQFTHLNFQNEFLLTLGKSADPNLSVFGGALEKDNEVIVNKLNTIGLAGELSWVFSRTGKYSGPSEYKKGDLIEQLMFFEYAYAPGDEDGYFDDNRTLDTNEVLSDTKYIARNTGKRSKDAHALSFHKNFQPSLIMFNGRTQINDMAVDGIFDPGRVMNATVLSLGYRYNDLNIGNFEVKAIYGALNENLTNTDLRAYYESHPNEVRPIGYYGKDLGMELDVKYLHSFGKNVEAGASAAALRPGQAWKTDVTAEPVTSYLIQTQLGFIF